MKDNRFCAESLLRVVMDAVPMPLFVVDADIRILDANLAGAQMVGDPPETLFKRLCGKVLHCIHERESIEDCGHTKFCPDCIIRESVKEALEGNHVVRRQTEMQVKKDGQARNAHFFITAAPFHHNDAFLTVLILEDVTELNEMKQILPICSRCKKIRNDEHYWESVELYLLKHTGLKFSHGVCPECSHKMYSNFQD